MDWKMIRLWLLVIGIIVWIPSWGFAQESAGSHEILLKLASSTMVSVQKTTVLDVKIPSDWEVNVHTGVSVSFRLPFHAGVFGRIEVISEEKTTEAMLEEINQQFHADFQIDSREEIKLAEFEGEAMNLSGRLAGEKWQMRIFRGRVSDKVSVRYYAASPELWFGVYRIYFDEILSGLRIK